MSGHGLSSSGTLQGVTSAPWGLGEEVPSTPGASLTAARLCPPVAINLIVQHIQDILNGGPSKRQTNGYLNGCTPARQRQASEPSSRPH